jgi:hypothetical protein
MRWKPFAKAGALLLAFAATAYSSYYVTRPAAANCKTSTLAELWTPSDHAYKATLLKKDCNLGESIFYSVRIDALSPPAERGWYTIREIEGDAWPIPDAPPQVVWVAARQLEITMDTKALHGRLTEKIDDLTVVRVFEAPNSMN